MLLNYIRTVPLFFMFPMAQLGSGVRFYWHPQPITGARPLYLKWLLHVVLPLHSVLLFTRISRRPGLEQHVGNVKPLGDQIIPAGCVRA